MKKFKTGKFRAFVAAFAVLFVISVMYSVSSFAADKDTAAENVTYNQQANDETGEISCEEIKFKNIPRCIEAGGEFKPDMEVYPDNHTDVIMFESSNPDIAGVDENGTVTPLKYGTVIITAYTNSGVKSCFSFLSLPKADGDTYIKKITLSSLEYVKLPDFKAVSGARVIIPNRLAAASAGRGFVAALNRGTGEEKVYIVKDGRLYARIELNIMKKPGSVSFTGSEAKMGLNEKYQSKLKFNSGEYSYGIKYSSSNPKVASVDSNGVITALSKGSAKITARTFNGKKAVISVKAGTPASSVELNYKSAAIGVNEKTLDLDSSAKGGYGFVRTYKSSNPNVASVNSAGVVTGKKTGSTDISVTLYNGKKAVCKVTVKEAPQTSSVKNTNKNHKIYVGSAKHKFLYSMGASASLYKKFTSSNASVATVDKNGYVKALKKGTADIFVTFYNGVKVKETVTVITGCFSMNTDSAQLALESDKVSRVVWGKSYKGQPLEAYIISASAKYNKTFVMDFAIHGFEDSYAKDGKVLVKQGNKLIAYYAENTAKLKGARLIIIPCLNPDGTMYGTNNLRACPSAYGRCTAQHIDMNRDFVSGKFKATETKQYCTFLNKYKPDLYINWHGWLDETIGTSKLCTVINKSLGLTYAQRNNYAVSQGYVYAYVHAKYSCPSVLVEYKSPNHVSNTKTINAVNNVLSAYN